MGKFNTAALGLGNGMLNQYSRELRDNFELVKIPIDQIIENENNNYSTDNIDELVDSIRTVGLKQNLDVMKLPNGKYKILSGHRRFKALTILAAEDEKYKMVACTVTELDSVKMPISDESKEKYLIHITNATQRDMTDADKYNQYKDLVSIYTEAKSHGFALSDKMRNLIASDMKASPAQVGKMDFIRNNAAPELEEKIEKNEVSIARANEIAHEDKDKQVAVAKVKKEKIIDTLDQDSYKLPINDLDPVTKSWVIVTKGFVNKAKDFTEIDKKTYAKILESREKIMAEIEKLQNIIEKM